MYDEGRALDCPALRRVAAVAPEDFAAKHWGRRPLLSPAEALPGDFADLFSLTAADELLSRRGLRTPFLRIAKNGVVVAADRYTGRGGVGAQVADQIVDDRVLELFADGHTLVLQGLHRLWPPLIDLAGALSNDLKHPVQINAYVTPRSSTGFAAHYDVHDVFVLQIAGEKRWRISEPVLVDPLRTQPWEQRRAEVAVRATESPAIDTVLRPGDCLYLPRGYLHAAEALDNVSVHLTVGVHPITRYDIVEVLAGLVADEPALRTSLPLGMDATEPDGIAADVAATIETLVRRVGSVGPEQIVERLAGRVVSGNRPGPLSPIAQAAALEALGSDTLLTARRHLRHALVDDGDQVTLTVAHRRLTFERHLGPALTALVAGQVLRVDDLPGLTSDDAHALARRLLLHGVVVPADQPPA